MRTLAIVTPKPLPARTEVEKGFASDEAFKDIAVTTKTAVGAKDVTVELPEGAIITKATAVCILTALNNAAGIQKVDLDLSVAGNPVFSQDDVLGLPDAEGSFASYVIVQDCSAYVTAPGAVSCSVEVTQSDAHSVRYVAQYVLIIAYKMG